MKRLFIVFSALLVFIFTASFYQSYQDESHYLRTYRFKISEFQDNQQQLMSFIKASDLSEEDGLIEVKERIRYLRLKLKAVDFWLRYLEPIEYKKINGPLPVEWETEVFEKFEAPYKREGAGLTLAELYLQEKNIDRNELIRLIKSSEKATEMFLLDSISQLLNSYDHFFLCNRLFLLNLAAIYTTGFECPDPSNIIPELIHLLENTSDIYQAYNQAFPKTPLSAAYTELFLQSTEFVRTQRADVNEFNHFVFIKDYVNPLFAMNQQMIRTYKVKSSSYNDYSLSNQSTSIFDKSMFRGQDPKGIFYSINDEVTLHEIKKTGKLLFYDPILSANLKRSCASCHKPEQYFTDTIATTALGFDKTESLPRNTPSLLNITYNHLVNLDGKHFNLQDQAKAVITSQSEMGGGGSDVLSRVLSCEEYKNAFRKFARLTPFSRDISMDHIVSAITLYLGGFSGYYSSFDEAMNEKKMISPEAIQGFNLFMGKAQCGTCHFVPHFNGVKPPYVGSEFEVLGVPLDTAYKQLSSDEGRHQVNPSVETLNAFRTGTIRNASHTAPYMHNGVFRTLREVMDFYNAGGGAGRLLPVSNQTLSSDSLRLSESEITAVIRFIESLNERVEFPKPPAALPVSKVKAFNSRKIGGEY